jgi:hypothetical protein
MTNSSVLCQLLGGSGRRQPAATPVCALLRAPSPVNPLPDLWESGQLGASAAHAVRASAEDERAIDEALGLVSVPLRLAKPQFQHLKRMAASKGIISQALIRQILAAALSPDLPCGKT